MSDLSWIFPGGLCHEHGHICRQVAMGGYFRFFKKNFDSGKLEGRQGIEHCPVDCIIVNPERVEGPDALLAKYRGLMGRL